MFKEKHKRRADSRKVVIFFIFCGHGQICGRNGRKWAGKAARRYIHFTDNMKCQSNPYWQLRCISIQTPKECFSTMLYQLLSSSSRSSSHRLQNLPHRILNNSSEPQWAPNKWTPGWSEQNFQRPKAFKLNQMKSTCCKRQTLFAWNCVN